MRRIEVKINGVQVDFESLESLPLSLKKQPDKFYTLGGAGGVELDSALRRIVIPTSKKLHRALGNQVGAPIDNLIESEYDFQMIVNGITVFSGSALLKEASVASLISKKASFELFGDGKNFWRLIDGLSLRDLDIGDVLWNRANILQSFSDTYADGAKGLFAPAIYGQPTGTALLDIENAGFKDADFRYHVYYPAIVDAIFAAVGYSNASQFYHHPVFQEHVHCFHGEKYPVWKTPPMPCNFTAVKFVPQTINNFEQVNFQNASGGSGSSCLQFSTNGLEITFLDDDVFNFDFQATAQNQSGTFANTGIEIWLNNQPHVFVAAQASTNAGGFQYDKQFELQVNTNDVLSIYANCNGSGSLQSINFTGTGTKFTPINARFFVQGCLPDEPVKDFLRGISHQFCLGWDINDITKQAAFEPRFPSKIGDERLPGFYHSLGALGNGTGGAGWVDAEPDVTAYTREYLHPFGSELVVAYQQKTKFAERNYPDDDSGIPAYGVRFTMRNPNLKPVTSWNPYFQFLPQGNFSSVITSNLPTFIDDLDDEGNLPTADDAKYDNLITCGLVYRGNARFYFDGDTETTSAPWISQFIDKYRPWGIVEKSFSGSYADVLASNPGLNPEPYPGLASTFYRDYAATCRRGVGISGKINVPFWRIVAESVRYLRRLNLNNYRNFWIFTEINKFKPTQFTTTGFKAIQKFTADIFDVTQKEKHWQIESFPKAQTLCDYSAKGTFKISPDENIEVIGIYLSNQYLLPLSYPYKSTISGEPERLVADLQNFLNLLEVTFASVTASITGSFNWQIQINQTDLIFNNVNFVYEGNDNNTVLNKDFTTSNCG